MIRGYGARVRWSDSDGGYVATCPEFPGLSGVAESADDALTELREALEMAVAALEEDGEPLPAPRTVAGYSGQFRLRVPRSLHADLARQAEDEEMSLNSYCLSLLAAAAARRDASARTTSPSARSRSSARRRRPNR